MIIVNDKLDNKSIINVREKLRINNLLLTNDFKKG